VIIFKQDENVRETPMTMEGVKGVFKKVLIGPEEGSDTIVMRHFRVEPGGHTPFHSHEFGHVVKVMSGRGIVFGGPGEETEVTAGQSLFVPGGTMHQFRNASQDPFEFLCIIERQD
jgi:quercetin dioxygenase-like cupin family protein